VQADPSDRGRGVPGPSERGGGTSRSPGQSPGDGPDLPEEPLAVIASRILEGERVDWAETPPPADVKSSRMLEQLRLLESLTGFHRSVQRSSTETPAEWELQSWGHLDIIEPIGSGSFGTVYHAWDPRLDREVALKILRSSDPGVARMEAVSAPASTPAAATSPTPPRAVARAIGEARLLAKVHHPNVVTVFGADEHDGLIGIWMELIEGETLWKLVRDQGPFGASEATAIGHDLLKALAAAHGAGILHRDIKAQNVMRAKGGRIVLMDFGLGREIRRERDRPGDWALGAALYAAPERLHGNEATVQSDLYSLGVLLYYLVTGRFPFEGANLAGLLEAHEGGARAYLRDRRPDLPHAFVEAIERALRAGPADRYGSAGEMDLALTAASPTAHAPLAAVRRLIPRARIPKPNWRRLAWLLALPLLVALVFWLGTLGRYSVHAALCRDLPHGGQASLTSRDFIGPDDHLFLGFEASRALHLYVVKRDPDGSLTLLFPSRQQRERNPLSPATPHRLSNLVLGQDLNWRDTKSGECELLLFIASPRPLAGLEAGLEDPSQPGSPVLTEEALTHALREHLPAAERRASGTALTAERVFALVRALGPEEEPLRGVWIRKLALPRAPQSYEQITTP
jgi:serine/threonine protein kinase